MLWIVFNTRDLIKNVYNYLNIGNYVSFTFKLALKQKKACQIMTFLLYFLFL